MNIEVDVRFGRAASRRAAPVGPMRLLLLGDFSGRGAQAAEGAAPVSARSVHRVDLDTLERVLARIAPQVAVPAPGGDTTVLRFSTLDEFHPDRLFERVASFERLRSLRARLLDPSTFDEAAAELQAYSLTARETSETAPAAPAAGTESDSATLERLLGGEFPGRPEATPPRASAVDALIRRMIEPHITRGSTPHLPVYLGAVDAAIGEQMRQLLHAPAFTRLEAAWRGVQWLVSRLELDENLQLHLLDVTRDELVSDQLGAQRDPSRSDLVRTLRAAGAGAGEGEGEDGDWALLAGLFSFGPGSEDLALVAALGSVAAQLGAAIVAAAAPALFGCHSVADLPDPLRWEALPADLSERWGALRRSAAARWIGLVAPRVLLRLPYGKATDPVEHFAFEEQPATPEHETLLWGPGSLALALLLGQAFAAGGWEQVASPPQDVDDLPAYTFSRSGEPQLQPCAEAFVGERAGEALLRLGLMPLLSHRQAARARLMRMQSVADPPQPLSGRWA
jgi:type VI secretion system protein ImpC